MSAQLDSPAAEAPALQNPAGAVVLARKWGWRNPPSEVLVMADLAARVGTDREAALVQLGVIDEVGLLRLRAQLPAGRDLLSWAAEMHPSTVQPVQEQVIAITSGSPFYSQIRILDQHPAMEEPDVQARCAALDCVIRLVEGSHPVVVFSNHHAMTIFETMGRAEKATDPLMRAAAGAPLLAVGSRDEISILIGRASGDRAFVAEQAAVWHAAGEADNGNPAQRELVRLIDHAISVDATDISMAPQRDGSYKLFVRRYGALVPAGTGSRWSPEVADAGVNALVNRSNANPDNTQFRSPRDGQISYRSTVGDAYLRLSFIPLNHMGEIKPRASVSVRLFSRSEQTISLGELGLPAEAVSALRDAVRMPAGAIVVSGPMNSGKSTTLAGCMGEHNVAFGDTKKRVSIEDPIERHIANVSQFNVPSVMLKQDGSKVEDAERFNEIMRGLKRHDVNAFWIGEVRDRESAEFCVNAAVSGCLAMTSIHAKDCVLAFDLLGQYVDQTKRFQLAESVSLVLSQRLVPKLCSCKGERVPTEEDQRQWQQYMEFAGEAFPLPPMIAFARGNDETGCDMCLDGYAGYALICEVLPFTREVRTAAGILAAREPGYAEARRAMAAKRSLTMVESAWREVCAGRVDIKSVLHL